MTCDLSHHMLHQSLQEITVGLRDLRLYSCMILFLVSQANKKKKKESLRGPEENFSSLVFDLRMQARMHAKTKDSVARRVHTPPKRLNFVRHHKHA